MTAARQGWGTPAQPWEFPPREEWEPEWTGTVTGKVSDGRRAMPLWKAWLPYLLVGLLLVLSRLNVLPFKAWLTGVSLTWSGISGSEIAVKLEPLYLPGTIFIVVVAMTALIHRMNPTETKEAVFTSAKLLAGTAVALAFAVPMARMFINSDAFFAPLTGAFGAFIAGSNTVSNMMFSLFQFGMAESIRASTVVVVALQAVGGAAGNMICVHNVVAAAATVGLVGREGILIRRVLLPMFYYVSFAGLLGLAAAYLL